MKRITVALAALSAFGQVRGPGPGAQLHPVDAAATYKLPSYTGDSGLGALQAGQRAQRLGLTSASATAAWQAAQTLLDRDMQTPVRPSSMKTVIFNGTTGSALNQLIASGAAAMIQVTASSISLDQPIEIQRSGVTLYLGATQLISANTQHYMLRVANAANVTVTGGLFVAGDCGILISASSGVQVGGVRMTNLTGAGIAITGSARVEVTGATISGSGLAGILIHRGTTQAIVRNNTVSAGRGFSNMMAGIVVSDREADITSDPRALLSADGYWVITQPITQRLNPPHDNLIAWNTVSGGVASGIYSDGSVRNVFFGNTLLGNSKEGLCLDNGSTANVVASNTVSDNGNRWGDPDSVLALDSILDGGRLPNGTAAEKVPGISLDNAVYNSVLGNTVAHNYGGGVKIVRTGYFNEIGLNNIVDDNDGAGPVFHFFGIELGAASGQSPELDFTPSHGNTVFSNLIRGSHYSGIFFDPGSDNNNVIYNSIMDAGAWALESAMPMNNTSVDNLTTLPSRNIGSGLDPALITSGQAVNDPPH